MTFPVNSLLAGNLASETGSLETASSSGESGTISKSARTNELVDALTGIGHVERKWDQRFESGQCRVNRTSPTTRWGLVAVPHGLLEPALTRDALAIALPGDCIVSNPLGGTTGLIRSRGIAD